MMMKLVRLLLLARWSLLFVVVVVVVDDDFASAYDNGLGLTPQMGWNPWNVYGCDINEQLIRDMAQAMVDSGLHKLGYEYINIDDCWQDSLRNATGYIQEDLEKFPSGMGALSDFVRDALGLKFGLYSDSGLMTCQRRPGGWGHEQQDACGIAFYKVSMEDRSIIYLKYDN